jgi:signal peptidase I
MNIFARRKCRKEAKGLIHHALHVVNMRGDLLGEPVVDRIKAATIAVSEAVKAGDMAVLQERMAALTTCLEKTTAAHPLRGGAFRENFEVAVVAVAVAMGLRAYFIQPFKIPTGSMQPTLYGITSQESADPSLMDRFPLKLVKVAVTGDWYSVRRAKASGRLGEALHSETDPSVVLFLIGGKRHKLPKDALIDGNGMRDTRFHPSREVRKGDVLWAGIRHSGDHLFVNKVVWNFRKPRRDEVMVFKTDGIPDLVQGTHYIKRMCGLPGETISIDPPHLVIDSQAVTGLHGIDRVTAAADGYSGYQFAGQINSPGKGWPLGKDEYFALGDNTRNSLDSRYWGVVPSRNLVGPAVLVYWPLSSRWGRIR